MTTTRDQKPRIATSVPQRRIDKTKRGEDAANKIANRSGNELPAPVRKRMEAHFDTDFSDVRVHHDIRATNAAGAFGARAITIGRHVAFNKGEFRPDYSNGQRLLAHELAHVMQQRGASAGRATFKPDARQEREADTAADRTMNGLSAQVGIASRGGALRIQADDRKSEGGTGDTQQSSQSQAASTTVNIVLRAPDDKYTNDVTDYVRNTLQEQVIEVDNIEEAAEKVAAYAKAEKVKVTNVRIIGHGSTTGGIKMTPKGETDRRFVTAQELEKLAADDKIRAKAKDAMAEDSTVEFWGCYIGGTDKSTEAVGQIFGSNVKSIETELRTAHDSFQRRADKGEAGERIKGHKGRWREVTSTKEIDDRVAKGDKALGRSFNEWLVGQARLLEADGDLPSQPDDAKRIAVMRDLFDRSGGKIKSLQIKAGSGETIRRGDKKKWLQQWKVKEKK